MRLMVWIIVVEEFVNHVGNNQNFDCSTGPEQMMDKDIHNEQHSHMTSKSTSGTRAVEGNRNNLEYCRNNSDKDNIVDKLRPTHKHELKIGFVRPSQLEHCIASDVVYEGTYNNNSRDGRSIIRKGKVRSTRQEEYF
ncbi:hypothetical protein Tco_0704611 [Tanacetum coccineum]|uniref:Uncharacterized protein n=1 Tax=Tanacetum coccineum TaxID=301880 RepID=A0ABQ4Y414_9ASTR